MGRSSSSMSSSKKAKPELLRRSQSSNGSARDSSGQKKVSVREKYRTLLDKGWELGTSAIADLGFADADRLSAKVYLRAAILAQIETLDMTQLEAARRAGLPQPKMSNLKCKLDSSGFSSDKLIDLATKLGLDVRIQVSPSRSKTGRVIVAPSLSSRRTSI